MQDGEFNLHGKKLANFVPSVRHTIAKVFPHFKGPLVMRVLKALKPSGFSYSNLDFLSTTYNRDQKGLLST